MTRTKWNLKLHFLPDQPIFNILGGKELIQLSEEAVTLNKFVSKTSYEKCNNHEL